MKKKMKNLGFNIAQHVLHQITLSLIRVNFYADLHLDVSRC